MLIFCAAAVLFPFFRKNRIQSCIEVWNTYIIQKYSLRWYTQVHIVSGRRRNCLVICVYVEIKYWLTDSETKAKYEYVHSKIFIFQKMKLLNIDQRCRRKLNVAQCEKLAIFLPLEFYMKCEFSKSAIYNMVKPLNNFYVKLILTNYGI